MFVRVFSPTKKLMRRLFDVTFVLNSIVHCPSPSIGFVEVHYLLSYLIVCPTLGKISQFPSNTKNPCWHLVHVLIISLLFFVIKHEKQLSEHS